MKKILHSLVVAAGLLMAVTTQAQVSGVVKDGSDNNAPIVGASIYWANTTIGSISDSNGEFSLGRVKGYDKLVASFIGYAPDTVQITSNKQVVEFSLHPAEMETIVVEGIRRGNYSSLNGLLKDEIISLSGLTKMACCSLCESFENSASVSVGYSDAMTGTKQIKMLGLAGVYTDVMEEGRPVMRGMGAPYALSYTPGAWLGGVSLSKGVTSVASSREAISGHINMQFPDAHTIAPFFFNAYADTEERYEANAYGNIQINDKLSTAIFGHMSNNTIKIDQNHDGFLDLPKTETYAVANRWEYASDPIQIRAGMKYVKDERLGGSMRFDHAVDRGSKHLYGTGINNESFNAFIKAAIPVGAHIYDEENQESKRSNIYLILDYNRFNTDNYFGYQKAYKGTEDAFYFNGQYSWYLNTSNHIVAGATATLNKFDEMARSNILNSNTLQPEEKVWDMDANEREAGVFIEYGYTHSDAFNVVLGYRADYHNMFGWIHTPRIHAKLNITPKLVLRGSAGYGSRTSNIFSDNMSAFATGRYFNVDALNNNHLFLETSMTYGGSLTWNFKLGYDDNAVLSFDYFHNNFYDQIVMDQERDQNSIYFYELDGDATSEAYQVDFNWTPARRLDLFASFRYNDTNVTIQRADGSLQTVERPLTSRYKGLVNLRYTMPNSKWIFDATAQFNGKSRVPTQTGNLNDDYMSPEYSMFFAQVTYKTKVLDVYVGCENIGNYTQKNPIIGANDPFSTAFNSSLIWGPLTGRKFYVGLRTNLVREDGHDHSHSHSRSHAYTYPRTDSGAHGHNHEGHDHDHEGHDHNHEGHDHNHEGHDHDHEGHDHDHEGHDHTH